MLQSVFRQTETTLISLRGYADLCLCWAHICNLVVNAMFRHIWLKQGYSGIRKTSSDISTTSIQGFNFTNSRFQLHEFTISTSRIHDFNFTNSRFQLHEFTNSTSRIQLHEFTNSTSRIHEFNFTNSRIQLHEFHFTNSTSRIQQLNS